MEQANLVTVICIAFNHEKWIVKALDSILLQSYEAKELIIVDNGSSDLSAGIIRDWVKKHSLELPVSAIYKSEPIPYCELFNEMLNLANGEYTVDLSGDDFLYPEHLSLSIDRLRQVPEAAFGFSDADICEEDGVIDKFYSANQISELKDKILGREFYQLLIRRSYISAPTMVFRTLFLKKESGYDGSLAYEDFDIQLRLTNKYPVVFSDHTGVYKRKHASSLSANQYQNYQSVMLPSTFRVCEKIRDMNRSDGENTALAERVLFELKHALWSANFQPAKGFVKLADELQVKGAEFRLYKFWLYLRLDISWLYVKLI